MFLAFRRKIVQPWKACKCYYIEDLRFFSVLTKAQPTSLEVRNLKVAKPTLVEETTQNKVIVPNHLWHPTPNYDFTKLLNYYKKLSKFRLTSLVVITSMAGYAMAPAPFVLSTFVISSLGTGLVSAAANAINQYHEVPFDSQMSRTKNRVLVTGKLTPLHAMGFAVVSATCGINLLYFGVNELAACLSAVNLFLYTSIYTPMKRITILNTWVGSIVGAIPPLIGWASCCENLDVGSFILAGLLYAWQFPHFNALSWNLRPDYSRAGYRMMAVTNPNLCRRTALRYSIAIAGLSFLSSVLEITNTSFCLVTLPLNGYLCYLAYAFYKSSDSASSRKLFKFSLIHLPILMSLFLLCKTHWFFMDSTDKLNQTSSTCNIVSQQISKTKNSTESIINLSEIKSSAKAPDSKSLLPLIPTTKAN